jgi:hypothetical protein
MMVSNEAQKTPHGNYYRLNVRRCLVGVCTLSTRRLRIPGVKILNNLL